MKSVDVTRVIPSRCAASVASVDFPVPVAPPTSSTTGESSCCSACSRRSRRIVRLASGSPSTSTASSLSRSRSRPVALPLLEVGVRAPGQLVGPRQRQPGGGQRARHQALRERRPVVAAERQRSEISPLAHAVATASAASRRNSASRSGSPGSGTTSFEASTTSDAARQRFLGDHVDRGGLQLDKEHVRVDPGQLRRECLPVSQRARHVHDIGAVLVAKVLGDHGVRLCRRGTEEGDGTPVDRLGGRGRSTVAMTRTRPRRPRSRLAAALRAELLPRPSSPRRDPPTGAGSRSGSRRPRRDPGARP